MVMKHKAINMFDRYNRFNIGQHMCVSLSSPWYAQATPSEVMEIGLGIDEKYLRPSWFDKQA
jgi:hypothetical protein